jgi:hypothetical protein
MASEILTGNWDAALDEMLKLREAIDQKVQKEITQIRDTYKSII